MPTPDTYTRGYTQGLADAGARLIGVVAGELGPDHPLIDRMVRRLGQLGEPTPTPEIVAHVLTVLAEPRAWAGRPGYGGSYMWTADGITVTLTDEEGVRVVLPAPDA